MGWRRGVLRRMGRFLILDGWLAGNDEDFLEGKVLLERKGGVLLSDDHISQLVCVVLH